jgi:hypothetical protein
VFVAVVDVGVVFVRVRQFFMLVRVCMRLTTIPGEVVIVTMMFVMNMRMNVNDRQVAMLVGVALRQM